MNADRDDHLLDACLDEVLGGRTPPDLTARILQAHAARRSIDISVLPPILPGPAARPGLTEPIAPPPVLASTNEAFAAAPANGHPVVALPPMRSSGRRRPGVSEWQSALVAAGVIGIGLVIGLAWYATRGPQIAVNKPGDNQPAGPVVAINDRPATGKSSPREIVGAGKSPRPDNGPSIAANHSATPSGSNDVQPPQVAVNNNNPRVTPAAPPQYRDPSPDPEVISFVNASLARSWAANSVTPSPAATDAEWCRRLFVRVLGRIPTVEELKSYTTDRSADKRQRLVNRLLTDEIYTEQFARHWATAWANVLIGRTGGRGDSLANRDSLEQFLRQSLATNKPYDQLAHELLTASGSAQPGEGDYNGAVNFLLAGMNQDATLATARVSRVFLGHQLQCAQCHNHPSQDWSQQQYWAFNSFLRQMHVEKAASAVKLVSADFGGQGKGSTDGEVFYETPTGLLKTAFPVFLDGTAIPPSGRLSEVDRRAELAKLVVASGDFPRALVNRLWSHFLGYGFTRPVDDMGPAGTGSNPELLDRLADEFVARRYDLKSVIRWIALSDSFARSSKIASLRSKDMPEAGEVALFSRYYSRQFGAEEVYNSLAQAAQIRKTAASGPDVEKARVEWLAQFNRPMGTDDAEEESHFSGGIGQSLIMMNGDLMRRAASSRDEGLLHSVVTSKLKFDEKVGHLFLAALSREPTRKELAAAREILAGSSGNESQAIEDIWWALLNSNEFILDH